MLGGRHASQRLQMAAVHCEDEVELLEVLDTDLPRALRAQIVAAAPRVLATCQSPRPADSMRSAIPASRQKLFRTASAVGDRQILPVQINSTEAMRLRLPSLFFFILAVAFG